MQATLCDRCGEQVKTPRLWRLKNVGALRNTTDSRAEFEVCGLGCLADLVADLICQRNKTGARATS